MVQPVGRAGLGGKVRSSTPGEGQGEVSGRLYIGHINMFKCQVSPEGSLVIEHAHCHLHMQKISFIMIQTPVTTLVFAYLPLLPLRISTYM